MRDSIKSWRPQPLATRSFLSDEDLDRLLAVLKLRGLGEDERRKVRAHIDNALVCFHHERDDETRPAIHLTAKQLKRIATESGNLCGLLGAEIAFDPDFMGLCRVGGTFVITSNPTKIASTKT